MGILVGLTGPAGVGKDTVAGCFRVAGYEHYAFAKPLKQALQILGMQEPETREAKEINYPGKTYSYRTAAQSLGTEWGRSLSPDFWIELAKQKYAESDNPRWVVSDVRFEEEANWIRSAGGLIIHVIGRQTTVSGKNATHLSERGILKQNEDLIFDNSGSIYQCSATAGHIIKQLESEYATKLAIGNRPILDSVDVPANR